MKLTRQKIVVEIDGARFEFREPTMRELLDFSNPGKRLDVIFGTLEKAEGVTDENGPVEVSRIKALDVPRDFMGAVVEAYVSDPFFAAKVDPEKKA
jgi:hypothetical protein